MRPLYIAIASLFFLISCENSGKKDISLLPKSVGNLNTLQVITPNELWNGAVGEEIRNYFAAAVDGLPQEEPLFSMNQMPPATYTDFARTYRLYLHINIGKVNKFSIEKDVSAKPQTGAYITATSTEGLIKLLEEHHKEIIAAFHATEITENQRRISVSMMKLDSLNNKMGVTMRIPSAYHVAKATDSFFWIRKELKQGTTNILVYEVPLSMIGKDSSVVAEIIKIRDSIGSKLLPVEDDDEFITEDAYAPYLFKTTIDGKPAFRTKGTWEVRNAWMGGPFLNYAIKDEANNRYLIIEGFTHAPSVAKRDLQFELEAILTSAIIK